MCGRVCVKHSNKEIEKAVQDLVMPYALAPRYNIPPTALLITISDELHERTPVARRWGLIPHWSKSPETVKNTFNARLETADQKPTFRSALRHHRCIIPVSGYYEWQVKGKNRQPFYITHTHKKPLLLAGIWDEWDKQDQIIQSCSIITIPASGAMKEIHHRMPIFLKPGEVDYWLDTKSYQNPKREFPWLNNRDTSLDFTHFYPVSDAVNHVSNDSEDLIIEVKRKPLAQQTEFDF